jgi:uncharacterized membrane protein (DUF2068 family)
MTLPDVARTGVEWDVILKAIPVAFAAATAIYKFRDARPRRRATLKADLELLKAAREQNLECMQLETSVRAELARLYDREKRAEWKTLAFGSVFALAFGVWTAYIVKDGFSWWALLTGFFTFIGISIALSGLEDSRRPKEEDGQGASAKPERDSLTARV